MSPDMDNLSDEFLETNRFDDLKKSCARLYAKNKVAFSAIAPIRGGESPCHKYFIDRERHMGREVLYKIQEDLHCRKFDGNSLMDHEIVMVSHPTEFANVPKIQDIH